jgi:hypothetical protein
MEPGTGLSSTFRPIVPITLLVLAEVLGEHGPGPVFLRHRERSTAERMVFGKAACGRRAFPEDRGGVLGYLDELGCDDCIEPDEVGEHLFYFSVLHTDEVISWSILMVLNLTEREVRQENASSFKDEAEGSEKSLLPHLVRDMASDLLILTLRKSKNLRFLSSPMSDDISDS